MGRRIRFKQPEPSSLSGLSGRSSTGPTVSAKQDEEKSSTPIEVAQTISLVEMKEIIRKSLMRKYDSEESDSSTNKPVTSEPVKTPRQMGRRIRFKQPEPSSLSGLSGRSGTGPTVSAKQDEEKSSTPIEVAQTISLVEMKEIIRKSLMRPYDSEESDSSTNKPVPSEPVKTPREMGRRIRFKQPEPSSLSELSGRSSTGPTVSAKQDEEKSSTPSDAAQTGRVMTLAEHIRDVIAKDFTRTCEAQKEKKSDSSTNKPVTSEPVKTQRQMERSIKRPKSSSLSELSGRSGTGPTVSAKQDEKSSTPSDAAQTGRVISLAEHIRDVIAKDYTRKYEAQKEKKSVSSTNKPVTSEPVKTPSLHPSEDKPSIPRKVDLKKEPVIKAESAPPVLEQQGAPWRPWSVHMSLSSPSPCPSAWSVRSNSSMDHPLCFPHLNIPSAMSPSPSVWSMRSDSSMFLPISFLHQKLLRQQRGLRSCSVCEEDLNDPVKLPCGHWSCKQCASPDEDHPDWPAVCSCKKCGKKLKRDPEHQTDTEEDAETLDVPSTPSTLQSVLLKKKIMTAETEREKLQVEKEKLQMEKEKLELEKRKLSLEIQLLEQKANSWC